MEMVDLHLNYAIIAAGGKHGRVGRAPGNCIASWLVGFQFEKEESVILMPDVDIAV